MKDELLAFLFSWRTIVVGTMIFGLLPGFAIRVITLAFHRDDPRRDEIRAELYAVPFKERPFWVAQQLEVAISEGLRDRIEWMATGRIIHRWSLTDGMKMNREYPDSFQIPTESEKADIEQGDLVKVGFQMTDWGERMWLEVLAVKRRHLVCRLNSHPLAIPRLNSGDNVKVKFTSVIDIEWREEALSRRQQDIPAATFEPGPWGGLRRACNCDQCERAT